MVTHGLLSWCPTNTQAFRLTLGLWISWAIPNQNKKKRGGGVPWKSEGVGYPHYRVICVWSHLLGRDDFPWRGGCPLWLWEGYCFDWLGLLQIVLVLQIFVWETFKVYMYVDSFFFGGGLDYTYKWYNFNRSFYHNVGWWWNLLISNGLWYPGSVNIVDHIYCLTASPAVLLCFWNEKMPRKRREWRNYRIEIFGECSSTGPNSIHISKQPQLSHITLSL